MENAVKAPLLPETFEGGGVVIDFDRSLCLPPDMAGVAMGYEAATVINALRVAAAEPTLPVRALELGTGSGVCLAALLHGVRQKESVAVTGLDVAEAAVTITRHNLAKEMQHGEQMAQGDVFVGDWYDDKVWERLGAHTYDAIICNPPYLAESTPLMDGYQTVPHVAVYAEDDGLAHHRFLLPRLLGLLSVRNGATLITRFHSTIRGEYELSQSIDKVVKDAIVQSPPLSDFVIVRRHSSAVDRGRNMATVTISRSESFSPPHMSPPYAL